MTRPIAGLVEELREREITVAVAESLTGGLLVAEFVAVPGVSAVLHGGIVAYAVPIKRDLVGVDGDLLERVGPVHLEVAGQMADRVRSALAVNGHAARLGLATTGVAGPGPEGGIAAGTAMIACAFDDAIATRDLRLEGSREAIRRAVVSEALMLLDEVLSSGVPRTGAGE